MICRLLKRKEMLREPKQGSLSEREQSGKSAGNRAGRRDKYTDYTVERRNRFKGIDLIDR